ncbi:MAG: glycosyltransferase family 4 protein [Patescibacteria group bacterium]|nr:glycosyltransferase family 4 protein [Patescibacteria group bacterium]
MKIAIVSLSYLPISNQSMGGLEAFVYSLSKKLIENGHNITLFGLEESKIDGKVIGITNLKNLREENLPLDNKYFVRRYVTYQMMALKEALKYDFDCIHVNLAEWQSGFLLNSDKNIVVTAHGNYLDKSLTKKIFAEYPQTKLVTTSKYSFNHLFTEYKNKYLVYNGIDLDNFKFNQSPKDYLVWMGRITPIKAPHVAIEVAKKLNKKLIIAGGIDYQDYFDEKIKPSLNKNIEYVGPIFGKEKNDLLANAQALLFTSDYPESFGMVPVEAMACGTPVATFRKGALPEVVKNGETGFVVDNVDEMINKIKNIQQISRQDCRQWVEKNFTLDRMVDEYLAIYRK